MILMMCYSILSWDTTWEIMYVVAFIPLIKHMITVKKNKEEHLLDGELKKVALSTFLMSILFLVGQFLNF